MEDYQGEYVVEIRNLRFEKPTKPWEVKVDRTSVLGNPFFMKDESKREEVCDRHREWFYNGMKEDRNYSTIKHSLDSLLSILLKYKRLNLFCWCAPKRCHAKVIREYLLKEAERKEELHE